MQDNYRRREKKSEVATDPNVEATKGSVLVWLV